MLSPTAISLYAEVMYHGDLPAIGIVLHDFALGGTERIAVRLAGAWARAGARVTIACGSNEGEMRALLDPRVRVIAADPPIARERGSRHTLARAAADIFARAPVDVCFVPGNFHWVVAPALARLARPPAIVAQVSAALAKPQRPRWKQVLFALRMRWLLRRVAAIVTLSTAAAAQARHIVRGPIVRAIPLPALPDDPAPPVPVPPGRRTLIAVGRLVPEKGFDLLIDAFARLADDRADLVIVGEGPDRRRLEALIAAKGLDSCVRLPGYVADTRPWLDAARLCVLPSRFEGYPAVLIEALAAGRAIVATDCTPAIAELIDDPDTGRAVPIDDAAAMAEALRTMLALPPADPAILARKVSRHRIGPVAQAYLDLFAEVAR